MQEERFAGYMDRLVKAVGHADRVAPLKAYCRGLLLPGERKSVEPMAARLAPHDVRRVHQSLHHLVAMAPWRDESILEQVRGHVLSALKTKGPVRAWMVDDAGFPKKGMGSVGVAQQYRGEIGKQARCQVAVSLSVSTNTASLPVAFCLYLPEAWAQDAKRREQAGVPEEIRFQTKAQIALEQIRQAVEDGVPAAPVLADAGYGVDREFRAGITDLGLSYMVGVQPFTGVWAVRPWRRQAGPHRSSAKELALSLPSTAWRTIAWREGNKQALRSRFAALRVWPAQRDYERAELYPQEWLLMEWPKGEGEPTGYWLSTLAAPAPVRELARMAKRRWIVKRDLEELKQDLGLGHYEGRGWRGFHHHATLCIAAYGFRVAERSRLESRRQPERLAPLVSHS